jgi:MATE family multidrug resistance protein
MSLLSQSLAENRRTLALAVPIIAGFVGQMLMGLADTIMVGRLGVVPLAACAFANTVIGVPLVFGFGVLSAVSIRASHAFGAGDRTRTGEALRAGTVLAAGLGLGIAAGLHLLTPFLALLGQKPEVNAATGTFLILCGWSIVPVFLTTAGKNFAEALGQPWIPFWIMLASVVLNVGLNWLLIYGNLGFPAMGLEGAGLATLLARVAGLVALAAYLASSRRLRPFLPETWRAPGLGKTVTSLTRLGLPVGALHFCEVSGFAFGSLMMGWISVAALAAHQIAITCAATTFMLPLGLAQAVCVRIGQARGGGQLARCRPIAVGGLGLAVAMMGTFAIGFIAGGPQIARWFLADETVLALTVQLLFLAGIFQLFDGLQVVASGALRGFEDTRTPMAIGVISYWLVALPISAVTAFGLGFGAPGIWVGFVGGLAMAAGLLLWLLRHRLHTLQIPA